MDDDEFPECETCGTNLYVGRCKGDAWWWKCHRCDAKWGAMKE